MPLYTYVLVYEGESCVVQGRHSNFEGFISCWTTDLPAGALPKLTVNRRRALARAAFSARFESVAGRERVWTKVIEVDGRELRVFAVETRG